MQQLTIFSASGSDSLPVSSDNTGLTESSGETSPSLLLIPTPSTRDWKGAATKGRDTLDSLVEKGQTKHRTGLLSSPAVSPANPSPLPDEDEARQTTATSGQTCLRLFDTQNPNGSSLRTCVDSLLGTKAWYSKQCALTWKAKVTKSNRLLFQLSPSVRRTGEIESGSSQGMLPTPRVSETEGAPVKNAKFNGKSWSRTNAKGVRFGVKVKDVVETLNQPQGLIPTPTASLSADGQDPQEFIRQMKERRERTKIAVKEGRVKAGSGRSMNLIVTVAATTLTGIETGKKLRLQPAMTQWMMGYPDLWTEFPTVEPSGEKKASKPTETESSQK